MPRIYPTHVDQEHLQAAVAHQMSGHGLQKLDHFQSVTGQIVVPHLKGNGFWSALKSGLGTLVRRLPGAAVSAITAGLAGGGKAGALTAGLGKLIGGDLETPKEMKSNAARQRQVLARLNALKV
jgi:hypothetical protein